MSKWDFKEMNVNHVWKAMFKATFGMLFFLVCTADKSSKALSWELLKIVGIKCQLVLVWCEKGKTVAICGDLDLPGLSSRYSLSNFFAVFLLWLVLQFSEWGCSNIVKEFREQSMESSTDQTPKSTKVMPSFTVKWKCCEQTEQTKLIMQLSNGHPKLRRIRHFSSLPFL